MNDFNFPILSDGQFIFPQEPLCPWCKKNKVLEPHSMAILNAGALLPDGENWKMADGAEAFFEMLWHGAHTDMNGTGRDPDIYASVEIVRTVAIGQFDLYFCSTACLRAFLNGCVDELENRISEARQLKGFDNDSHSR